MGNCINIQLFGGPGIGKSTTATGLFYHMKLKNYKVEYIQEYAKELVYSLDKTKLDDQLLILGEQHHRMLRLIDKVDYIIHDSPFIMGLAYLDENKLPNKEFKKLVESLYNQYDNINIFLNRNNTLDYEDYGREQNLKEAIQKDNDIKNLLNEHNISFIDINIDDNTIDNILNIITKKEF